MLKFELVTGTAADSSPIPLDGIPNLAYDTATNRITTSGFEYDAAGNQTRALAADGVNWLLYQYDAANRIHIVKQDGTTPTDVQAFQYGSTNARLMDYDYNTNQLKIFATAGGTTLAEYTEFSAATPTWTKSYTYFGDSQLGTITPNGTGGEFTEFNHPDRLGTRVQTNQAGGTSYEQTTLPFGTALNAESTVSNNNKRFTSYDRSNATGLDYAINRTYDSKQGRFTQVDPIGMQAVDFKSPQSLNLYAYGANDPINRVDPDGLFLGKLFNWLKKALKWIAVVITVTIAVLTIIYAPVLFTSVFKAILGIISTVAGAVESVLSAFNLTKAARVFGIISSVASLGTSILAYRSASEAVKLRALLNVVSSSATVVSKTLTAFGHKKLSKIFSMISAITGYMASGLKDKMEKIDGVDTVVGLRWDPDKWKTFMFIRSLAEQVSSLVGATKLESYLNIAGIVDDFRDLYLGFTNFSKENYPEKVGILNFRTGIRDTNLPGWMELIIRWQHNNINVTKKTGAIVGKFNSITGRIDKLITVTR